MIRKTPAIAALSAAAAIALAGTAPAAAKPAVKSVPAASQAKKAKKPRRLTAEQLCAASQDEREHKLNGCESIGDDHVNASRPTLDVQIVKAAHKTVQDRWIVPAQYIVVSQTCTYTQKGREIKLQHCARPVTYTQNNQFKFKR